MDAATPSAGELIHVSDAIFQCLLWSRTVVDFCRQEPSELETPDFQAEFLASAAKSLKARIDDTEAHLAWIGAMDVFRMAGGNVCGHYRAMLYANDVRKALFDRWVFDPGISIESNLAAVRVIISELPEARYREIAETMDQERAKGAAVVGAMNRGDTEALTVAMKYQTVETILGPRPNADVPALDADALFETMRLAAEKGAHDAMKLAEKESTNHAAWIESVFAAGGDPKALAIIQGDAKAERKIESLRELDNRFWGYSAAQWAKILNCSRQNIDKIFRNRPDLKPK